MRLRIPPPLPPPPRYLFLLLLLSRIPTAVREPLTRMEISDRPFPLLFRSFFPSSFPAFLFPRAFP